MDITTLRPETLGPTPTALRPGAPPAVPGGDAFAEALLKAGSQIVNNESAAARAVETFARGAEGKLHETLLAVDKADISLKFLVTVRNRLLDAYREMMRMGV